ncbi:hypothetical protein H8S95_16590 [Pontibacter sp. KCTC 32443]|uniref:hypothetical protein n=1 Tax=Pontibacter TaxID=323449 RepID=UPI00164E8C1F|nr:MULTISPECIES: hypothetical protein [Pontibacter]MBC5775698.1 hypothetical protein [Pontibacter sp. KCTC 32443]
MNKNVIAVFAAVCGLFMASCDTPKDYRPGEKVSTDYVEPGTRSTSNVSDAGVKDIAEGGDAAHGASTHGEVMPNHDQGDNTIQPGDSVREAGETNTAAGAVKPSPKKP